MELNVGSVLWSDSSRSRALWTDVLSDGLYESVLSNSPQPWVGPGLPGAQIVDLQLKLRFLINALAQSQAVFALFSGGFQG